MDEEVGSIMNKGGVPGGAGFRNGKTQIHGAPQHRALSFLHRTYTMTRSNGYCLWYLVSFVDVYVFLSTYHGRPVLWELLVTEARSCLCFRSASFRALAFPCLRQRPPSRSFTASGRHIPCLHDAGTSPHYQIFDLSLDLS